MADANGWTLVQPAAAPAAPGWTLVQPAPTFHSENAKDAQGNALVVGGKSISLEGVPEDVKAQLRRIASGEGANDPDAILSNVRNIVTGWIEHGPHAVVEGLRDMARGQYARGGRGVISGGAITAAPMLAPAAIPEMVAAPITTALMTAAGLVTGKASSTVASALGATPDQAGLAGDIGGMVGGAAAGAVRAGVGAGRGLLATTRNPVERSAVQFAEREGIPLDAGTKTGSQFIKHVQKRVGATWGGAPIVESAQEGQAAALDRVGGQLADRANPGGTPQTAVSAGEGVSKAVDDAIRGLDATADKSYTTFRTLAQQRSSAVNVAAAKKQLQPVYDQLLRESQLNIPMQGGKGRALSALDGLMRGPDVTGIEAVEGALGDLKAMSRGADMPELRSQGQGLAAQAVKALDAQVQAAAQKAGPDVYKALMDGRAATAQKWATSDVRDLLSAEPGQVFRQLTANKDTAVAKIRAVQSVAPDQLPNVARAYLENLMDRATAEGGFSRADGLLADWQKLGPETKARLFPDAALRQDLTDFFVVAKRIGMNVNSSGTAATMHALDVVTAIPSAAIAKVLYTPSGVRLLTSGIRLSLSSSAAARAAGTAQLSRALRVAGVPVTADDQPTGQRPAPEQ